MFYPKSFKNGWFSSANAKKKPAVYQRVLINVSAWHLWLVVRMY